MTLSALILVMLSFFMALLCSWVILAPFFELGETSDHARAQKNRDSLKELRLKKETMLDALEDLESDYLTHRVDQPDYDLAKDELTNEAAELLSNIDTLEGDSGKTASSGKIVTAPIPRKQQR